jgi:hypothetical protein
MKPKRAVFCKREDKIFQDEADLIADAKETNMYEDEESSLSDHIDDMEEEEFTLGRNSKKKVKNIGKRNAQDRAADTNADDLEEREDEADDTVFIDNLPKDEQSLRMMIKEVNFHIRDLEKAFFEEEDSEVEQELKRNLGTNFLTAAEHNH